MVRGHVEGLVPHDVGIGARQRVDALEIDRRLQEIDLAASERRLRRRIVLEDELVDLIDVRLTGIPVGRILLQHPDGAALRGRRIELKRAGADGAVLEVAVLLEDLVRQHRHERRRGEVEEGHKRRLERDLRRRVVRRLNALHSLEEPAEDARGQAGEGRSEAGVILEAELEVVRDQRPAVHRLLAAELHPRPHMEDEGLRIGHFPARCQLGLKRQLRVRHAWAVLPTEDCVVDEVIVNGTAGAAVGRIPVVGLVENTLRERSARSRLPGDGRVPGRPAPAAAAGHRQRGAAAESQPHQAATTQPLPAACLSAAIPELHLRTSPNHLPRRTRGVLWSDY